MKVLSLKQTYAELILQGRKIIEIRKWNTKFRGDFLIHTSKNPDYEAMERFGFIDLKIFCSKCFKGGTGPCYADFDLVHHPGNYSNLVKNRKIRGKSLL